MTRARNGFLLMLWICGTCSGQLLVENGNRQAANLTSEATEAAYAECSASSEQCNDKTFESLYGRWLGLSKAAQSIFGTLIISENLLSWGGGTLPFCRTKYVISSRFTGSSYPDEPRAFLHSLSRGSYTTYRLRISDSECGKTARFLQIAVTADMDIAEIVVYNGPPASGATGEMMFARVK